MLLRTNNFAIIFVCHDNDSISKVIHYNHHIILVGYKEISKEYLQYPKLIIARDLKNNIENEQKLLSFTAWYAIIKNNLFSEYDYLCILEYDVLLHELFENYINDTLNSSNISNISFIIRYEHIYTYDTNINVMNKFLELKNIDPNIVSQMNGWGNTTNQCIRRDILSDFVD